MHLSLHLLYLYNDDSIYNIHIVTLGLLDIIYKNMTMIFWLVSYKLL